MSRHLLLATLVASRALAWELPCNWTSDTTTLANEAGGGGLFATGGKRDYSVKCSACHQQTLVTPAPGLIDTTVSFLPPLGTVGTVKTFTPAQRYEVTVTLTGESLGLSGCGTQEHVNTFAATFEDAAGNTVGLIESDTGQSSTSCLTGLTSQSCFGPLPATGGTTFMAGDCHAVAGYGENRTTWKFYWTPPAGTALTEATLFWGAVDGDCKLNSIGDDVKERQLTIRRAGAGRWAPSGKAWASLWFSMILVGGFGAVLERRGRRARRSPAS